MKTIRTNHRNLRMFILMVFFSIFAYYASIAQNVGIGVADPSAALHLKAGTTTAGTAPLKFTAGPLLTTVEPGAIEYKGHTFYATTYLVRRSIMLAQDVVMATVPVTGTISETTIYTATMAADYLTAGKMINIKLYGNYRTNGGGPYFTVNVKEGSNLLFSMPSTVKDVTALTAWDMDIRLTVRNAGLTGSVTSYGKITQDLLASNSNFNAAAVYNTTLVNTITVTITWSSNHGNNQFNLLGGATECVDANN